VETSDVQPAKTHPHVSLPLLPLGSRRQGRLLVGWSH